MTQSFPAWDKSYQALLQFRQQHGHCAVPKVCPSNPTLAKWLITQRTLGEALPLERLEKLHQAGVRFATVKQESWIIHFFELKRFKEEKGHCDVPYQWLPNPLLYGWTIHQRNRYSKRKLSGPRQALLNQLGFDWNGILKRQYQQLWDTRYAELCRFRDQHGHCRIPCEKSVYKLYQWANNQRRRRAGLSAERMERLDAVGFEWNRKSDYDLAWERQFEEVKAYVDRHGSLEGLCSYNEGLAKWVCEQRYRARDGKRSRVHCRRLSEIGISLFPKPYFTSFKERLDQLKRFKRKHGHVYVSSMSQGKHSPLGAWYLRIRKQWRKGTLKSDRKIKLDAIGFIWDAKQRLLLPN